MPRALDPTLLDAPHRPLRPLAGLAVLILALATLFPGTAAAQFGCAINAVPNGVVCNAPGGTCLTNGGGGRVLIGNCTDFPNRGRPRCACIPDALPQPPAPPAPGAVSLDYPPAYTHAPKRSRTPTLEEAQAEFILEIRDAVAAAGAFEDVRAATDHETACAQLETLLADLAETRAIVDRLRPIVTYSLELVAALDTVIVNWNDVAASAESCGIAFPNVQGLAEVVAVKSEVTAAFRAVPVGDDGATGAATTK